MTDNLKDSKKKTEDDDENKKNKHTGHRERLRKKFLKSGFETFEEHEILELVLFYAIPRIDTNDIAHDLIDKFKGFKGVCDADVNELIKEKYINENCAVLIKMIPQLAKVYTSSKEKEIVLNTTSAMCAYFVNRFLGDTNEKIRIVCVDKKLQLINETIIAEGTPGKVDFKIRKIAEFAYSNNCEDIIIAHNHPRSNAHPSSDDIKVTSEIYKILKPVGINLLDHIVVAGNDSTSLKEYGVFSMFR